MNKNNDAPTIYPLESIEALRPIKLCFISPPIESEDQLPRLLEELRPVLDEWMIAGGVEDKQMVALLYNPPGDAHKRSVCAYIVDTGSEYPYYSFDRIVQQLDENPNVIIDEGELLSHEVLERRYWVGYLAVVVMPLHVWEALPISGPGKDFEMDGSYPISMLCLGIHWIMAHPLPKGWKLETIGFEPRELGFGQGTMGDGDNADSTNDGSNEPPEAEQQVI